MQKIGAIEELFLAACGDELRAHDGFSVRGELGVFSSAVVVYLGIQQRLSGQSQSGVLGDFAERLEEYGVGALVERPSRKLRECDISINSGGLSRARERLSEQFCQELFTKGARNIEAHFAALGQRASNTYLIDGVVFTVADSEETRSHYGVVKHRKKALHYPRVRCVAAHRLDTGVSQALVIGSITDHETTLAKRVLEQLPKGCTVVMDRGFATPALAQRAAELGIFVVVRLKNSIGKKLLAKQAGTNSVLWASSMQAKLHMQATGRVVYVNNEIPGFRSTEFYLFTSAPQGDTETGNLYRQRVQIETAIRHVKQTLNLFFVVSKTPEAIRKELYIAYLTFNLIRAIMEDTALFHNVPVTRLSFTATVQLTKIYGRALLRAKPSEYSKVLLRFRTHIREQLLPNRLKPRSYPRHVKMPRDKYPSASTIPLVNQEKGK
jgi:hypothetical protein